MKFIFFTILMQLSIYRYTNINVVKQKYHGTQIFEYSRLVDLTSYPVKFTMIGIKTSNYYVLLQATDDNVVNIKTFKTESEFNKSIEVK